MNNKQQSESEECSTIRKCKTQETVWMRSILRWVRQVKESWEMDWFWGEELVFQLFGSFLWIIFCTEKVLAIEDVKRSSEGKRREGIQTFLG